MTVSLNEIKIGTPADVVADLIASEALKLDRLPYCFSIDHNVGPPRYLPCALPYDWYKGKEVGINTKDRSQAYYWLVRALISGYRITRVDPKRHEADGGISTSIKRARESAAYQQKVKDNPDDDIPF